MSSYVYFTIILIQIVFVLIFAYHLRKCGAYTTYHYVLCVLMLMLYSFEFIREIRIFLGNTLLMNTNRLIILRIEHTIMGMFLSEVFKYVKKIYDAKNQKISR